MKKLDKEKIKWIMPVGALIVAYCVFTLIMYPIVSVQPAMQKKVMFGLMIGVMTLMPTLVTAIFTSLHIKANKQDIKKQSIYLGIQFAYAFVLSFVIGFTTVGIASGLCGVKDSYFQLSMLIAFASFAVQTIVIGAFNWLGKKAFAIPAILVIFGMPCMSVLASVLPWFWRYCIATWIPIRYLADGVKNILNNPLADASMTACIIALTITTIIGLALLFSAIAKPKLLKTKSETKQN